jgi:RNA polymerase sigma-70 factor (ECF subfamily)
LVKKLGYRCHKYFRLALENYTSLVLNERTLIKYCLEGNQLAQRQLFDAYFGKMFYVAMRYLSDKTDAEDVLAEAFKRIFAKLNNFRYDGEGSLGRWIKTIVINESLRALSQKKRLVYIEDLAVLKPEVDKQFDESLDMEYLMSEIQLLPDGYRVVFNLYVMENYTHPEIAEMLKISVSTSKTQLYKARQHLIKQLNKQREYELGRN